MSDLRAVPLNPAQQEVVDLLGATAEERPQFDAGLRHELRTELETALGPALDLVPDDSTLWVSKHALAGVHGCEARHLAERDAPFEWSVPVARGTVAHKAVELLVNWQGEPSPGEMVEEAVARLAEGTDGLAEWLQRADEIDHAELRAQAVERVTKFVECFPPLKRQWRPVTESRVRVELFDQRLVLSGKVDLCLGRSEGTTAGKVLIDLKTGGFSPTHIDDLRFYALLETIRLGTPPRLLASYYLDSGEPHPEAVTVDLLYSAVARATDGVGRLVELLHADAQPRRRPGVACRWCALLSGCEDGRRHLADGEGDDHDDDLPF